MAKDYEDYELEEEEDEEYSVKEAIKDILLRMKHCDPTSDEYAKLSQRLTELTEAQKNKNSWFWQVVIQGCSTVINTGVGFFINRKTVKDVLVHEDRGNILTTKSTSFIKKP